MGRFQPHKMIREHNNNRKECSPRLPTGSSRFVFGTSAIGNFCAPIGRFAVKADSPALRCNARAA